MKNYLKEIEFAATKTLEAVWHEHAEFVAMNTELGQIFDKVGAQAEAARSTGIHAVNPNDLDVLIRKSDEVDKLKRKIRARDFAVGALSGTLLQFAKQGISISHGDFHACPDGRPIGSQSLKSIIWNARNQSFHWEERRLRPEVKKCFKRLAIEFGLTGFGMFHAKNCALAVVELLGWRNFEEFKRDLLLLE